MEFSEALEGAIAEHGSVYGAAKQVAPETGEYVKTAHQRLSRWYDRTPETWLLAVETFRALGYRVSIEKMRDSL